jgi:hypothetical protein
MIGFWIVHRTREHFVDEMALAACKKLLAPLYKKLVKRLPNPLDFIVPIDFLSEIKRTVMMVLVVLVCICGIGLTIYGMKKSLHA